MLGPNRLAATPPPAVVEHYRNHQTSRVGEAIARQFFWLLAFSSQKTPRPMSDAIDGFNIST